MRSGSNSHLFNAPPNPNKHGIAITRSHIPPDRSWWQPQTGEDRDAWYARLKAEERRMRGERLVIVVRQHS